MMKNPQKRPAVTVILSVLWIALSMAVVSIVYNNNEALNYTDYESFSRGVERVLGFYEDNWDVNFEEFPADDSKRTYPDAPLWIPYSVYDQDGTFLAAASRDILYDRHYTEYEIENGGEVKGVVRIHYSIVGERIRDHQTAIQKAVLLCLVILVIIVCVEYINKRKDKNTGEELNNGN